MKLRDELLNREISSTLMEAKILFEGWRRQHSQVRPHSFLDYCTPTPEAVQLAITTKTLTSRLIIITWGQIISIRAVY